MNCKWKVRSIIFILISVLSLNVTSSICATLVLSGEPTGGEWETIVLKDANSISLDPPPENGSAEQSKEIEEIKEIQTKRTPQMGKVIRFWDEGATIRWNEIAREMVASHKTDPPMASRTYALLSVAQYDALVTALKYKYKFGRARPDQIDAGIYPMVIVRSDPCYPSEHAAVAAASAEILKYAYPENASLFDDKAKEHQESRVWAGVSFRSNIEAGDAIGRAVAREVIDRAKADGSDAIWNGTLPTGPGYWTGSGPVRPLWGHVKAWLISNVSQARPLPPPSVDSEEFKEALKEVRAISDNRTAEQLEIAKRWSDGAGTYTPPGHWNEIACKLIKEEGLNELRSARALALMNMAVMDAGICCWDAKYYYCEIRPWQVDPEITTPVGKPNFPSYTSGHSSFSSAAAEVLSYLFPTKKSWINSAADEAGVSRLYGGIHYRFDIDAAAEGGRKIGLMAVERGRRDGSP